MSEKLCIWPFLISSSNFGYHISWILVYISIFDPHFIPRSHWLPGRSLTASRRQCMSLFIRHAQQWRETWTSAVQRACPLNLTRPEWVKFNFGFYSCHHLLMCLLLVHQLHGGYYQYYLFVRCCWNSVKQRLHIWTHCWREQQKSNLVQRTKLCFYNKPVPSVRRWTKWRPGSRKSKITFIAMLSVIILLGARWAACAIQRNA